MAPLDELDATYHLRWSDDLYEELSRQELDREIYKVWEVWPPRRGPPYLSPSPTHSLHRVGDATQGWDPVADAPLRLRLLSRGMVLLPLMGLTRLTPLAPNPANGDGEGDGVEILPSRHERRAQTVPHLTPTRDLVVHEVQASLPPGRPLMMPGGRGGGARGIW
jgi:hypothetical protein